MFRDPHVSRVNMGGCACSSHGGLRVLRQLRLAVAGEAGPPLLIELPEAVLLQPRAKLGSRFCKVPDGPAYRM